MNPVHDINLKVDVDTADSCNCCFPVKKKEHKKKPYHHHARHERSKSDTSIRDINMVAGEVFIFSKPEEKK